MNSAKKGSVFDTPNMRPSRLLSPALYQATDNSDKDGSVYNFLSSAVIILHLKLCICAAVIDLIAA